MPTSNEKNVCLFHTSIKTGSTSYILKKKKDWFIVMSSRCMIYSQTKMYSDTISFIKGALELKIEFTSALLHN